MNSVQTGLVAVALISCAASVPLAYLYLESPMYRRRHERLLKRNGFIFIEEYSCWVNFERRILMTRRYVMSPIFDRSDINPSCRPLSQWTVERRASEYFDDDLLREIVEFANKKEL